MSCIAPASYSPHLGRFFASLKWSRTLVYLPLLVAFLISMLSLPRPASERDLLLDNSWEQALAYLYRHHAQAGTDYIFAYGPLGVYYTQVYDAELYWLKFGWEILLKLALASIAVAALRRMPGAGLKIAYCFLFFTFLGENRGDTLFPHLFLAAALILCDRGSLSTFFALFLALLAVVALVSFPSLSWHFYTC